MIFFHLTLATTLKTYTVNYQKSNYGETKTISAFIVHNLFKINFIKQTLILKNQEYLLQRGQEPQKTVGGCSGQINISTPIHTQQCEAWADTQRKRMKNLKRKAFQTTKIPELPLSKGSSKVTHASHGFNHQCNRGLKTFSINSTLL